MGELASARYAVSDPLEAIEFCYEQGWTDGLPVVPPTPERVAAFLAVMGLPAEAGLGVLAEADTVITAEKLAVNAVMAGCLPAYLPVLVAAVEALTTPALGLYAWLTSTGSAAPLLIVNGPPRHALGLNAGAGLFGPGPRANATIARAVGLLLRNVCDARPGGLDQSAFGRLASYAWCIAEDEEATAWEPLHAERGLPREAGAVTVLAAEAPHLVRNAYGAAPEEVLSTVADTIAYGGWSSGACLVAIGPEHRAILERAGWSKADVRAYLVERARRPVAELKRAGLLRGGVVPGDAWRLSPLLAEDDLLIVAAGGPGTFSAVVPPWVGGRAAQPVTCRVFAPAPEEAVAEEAVDQEAVAEEPAAAEGAAVEGTAVAAALPAPALVVSTAVGVGQMAGDAERRAVSVSGAVDAQAGADDSPAAPAAAPAVAPVASAEPGNTLRGYGAEPAPAVGAGESAPAALVVEPMPAALAAEPAPAALTPEPMPAALTPESAPAAVAEEPPPAAFAGEPMPAVGAAELSPPALAAAPDALPHAAAPSPVGPLPSPEVPPESRPSRP